MQKLRNDYFWLHVKWGCSVKFKRTCCGCAYKSLLCVMKVFFKKVLRVIPLVYSRFKGGLKNFNLKSLLWGHLLLISFLLFSLKLNVFNCRGSSQGPPQERGVKVRSAPLEATLNIHINQKVLKKFCKTHEYLKKINLVGILIRIFKSCEIVANQPSNPMKILSGLI